MEGNENCTCGHVYEEHGGDVEYPGSSACNVPDCDCVCFEEDAEDEN
jgi:hypothetical protein